jgi:hypothetical protein
MMKTALMITMCALCAADTSKSECDSASNAKWIDGECFCAEGFLPSSYEEGGIPCVQKQEALEGYCDEDPNSVWKEDHSGCFCR